MVGCGVGTAHLSDANVPLNEWKPLVFQDLRVEFTVSLQPGTELRVFHRAGATLRLDEDQRVHAGLGELFDTGLRGTDFAVRFTNISDRVRLDVAPAIERGPGEPRHAWDDAWTIAIDSTGVQSRGFGIPEWNLDTLDNLRPDLAGNRGAAGFQFEIRSGEIAIDDFAMTGACRIGSCFF